MTTDVDVIRRVSRAFCLEFLECPYLCYTEHGLHARFYEKLYHALPAEDRYTTWMGQRVCVVQKEYPTFGCLGKPKRQHWDLAVIRVPLEAARDDVKPGYDYLRLVAAIEFGLNEPEVHLKDDVDRLCHPEAGVDYGFIFHLYRLSEPKAKFSGRDWSADSGRILPKEQVAKLAVGRRVEIFYCLYNSRGRREGWAIGPNGIKPLKEL
jgi:hypothetical protein